MVFEKVQQIIAEKLDIDPSVVSEQSKFSDMQIDSLYMVEIMLALEDEFNIMIDEPENIEGVADLVAFIERKIN